MVKRELGRQFHINSVKYTCMYIPIWIIVAAVVAYYFWSKSKQEQRQDNTVGRCEEVVYHYKQSLMEFAHFDSPRIIDLQDKYDVMEANYLRLKQRYLSNEEKKLEVARDWARYVESLDELRHARVMLDVDWSDKAYENFADRAKEPGIITEEVENKFKSLLGKDFYKLPLDYDERRKKAGKEDELLPSLKEDWKLYHDSPNYLRMVEYREKEKKEKK